ncbi:putative peroxisomal-coenzyme A synthetase [Bradysia coprophila]|uniref:putative peroxisomal-coenzyme A synthetase n=1 Tax=Bradysia coprophila TaxID=38358 RepID=UPI00187DBE06|nr:putative peroxisomal-coenzyme A synthetase [Bradysia coprophila]
MDSTATLRAIFDRDNGNQTAVIIPRSCPIPTTLSYNQLYEVVQEFCAKLASIVPRSQLAPGNSISIAYPNSLEFVVSFLACGLMRLVASPLNPAYTKEEFLFYLEDANSTVMIVPPGSIKSNYAAVLAAQQRRGIHVIEVFWNGKSIVMNTAQTEGSSSGQSVVFSPQPEDVALLLHTSGTTGRPKGVPLSHLNLTTSMKNVSNTYKLTPNDRTLLVMPLFHIHGLICGLLATLLSGGSAVIPQRFSASTFWSDYTDMKCNWYTAVPTMHQILLQKPPSTIPYIRFIRSCSSSLAPTTFHALKRTFKAPVLEAYAMTEASHQMTSNPLPEFGESKPGTVGLGQGVEVAILDDKGNPVEEGEVCVRGRNVTRGYLNNPQANAEAFTADGFFRTGDQGKKDKDGYLILTGRIKELINRGGEKISPLELDAILLTHPSVSEAVTFGVPSEMYGQEVHAAVVLKSPTKSVAAVEKELQNYVQSKVAKFKVPKRIHVTDQLPKGGTGKIQRRLMANIFAKSEPNLKSKL